MCIPDIPAVEVAKKDQFKYSVGFESEQKLKDFFSHKIKLVLLRIIFGSGKIHEVNVALPSTSEEKQEKLRRVLPLTECVNCSVDLVPEWHNEGKDNLAGLRCPECSSFFEYDGNSLNFLTPGLREKFSVKPTDNVSSWGYDPKLNELLAKSPDKLFLDVGAGWRSKAFANVINYEIKNYPSTDVLGVGERLPFKDASFDGVISVAVLEHVLKPSLCADEMVRVLKPGGELFCSAAFLQPVHAYPDHYYNMTAQGLIALFPDLEISEVFVPKAHHPMRIIGWIIRTYLKWLPERKRRKLLSKTVEELIAMDDFRSMPDNPFVKEFPEEKMFEIAGGTAIVARKPSDKK
ncbi:MAG: class I SAM-dependent methyltransferase [Lentisphaerae bacterium]|nr:class I SAM-dependent methyltransferase [Lentisphaerota bacterium]